MKMQYLPLSPKGLPSKEEETPYGPKRVLFKIAEHEVTYVVGRSKVGYALHDYFLDKDWGKF